MARRRGFRRPQVRTRTITKTRFRTRFAGASRRFRSARSRVSGLHGGKKHVVAITSGAGIGGLSSVGTTVAMGQNKPMWLAPLIGFLGGLATGKMTMKSWGSAIETGLAGAGTAYAADRVIAGESLIPSLQSQQGVIPQGLQVF